MAGTGTYTRLYKNKAGDLGKLTAGQEMELENGAGYTIAIVAGSSATWSFVDNYGNETDPISAFFTLPNLRGPFENRPGTDANFKIKCLSGSINIFQHSV